MKTNIFYDKAFRSKIRHADKESLKQLMASTSGDAQIKVLTDTKSITYFVIPDLATLDSAGLTDIQAAGKLGTAGSVGSASTGGTISSASSTILTLGSVATVGSAGTANPVG